MILTIKTAENNRVGENVEKLEPLCIIGGNVKWYRHLIYSTGIPQKLKNLITCISAVSDPYNYNKASQKDLLVT